MNFEAAQVHSLSDVFAAVAIMVVSMQLMFTVHFFFSERSLELFLYKTKQKNHLAFIILLHQEHKWKMFIEIDGEENVLLLVKVRSYTHRKKSNPTNVVFLSRYVTCYIPVKRPHSNLTKKPYIARSNVQCSRNYCFV